MKRFLITSCCLVAATSAALAQGNRNGFPIVRSKESIKTAQEAAKVLEKAKAGGLEDLQRKTADQPQLERMAEIAAQAKQSGATQPTFAERTREAESKARLQDAMTRLTPEGKVLLAQSATSPTMRAPDDAPVASPAVKASPLSTDGPGPKPQPLRPTPLETPEKKPAAKTIIDAGSSFFDSRQGFGVFVDNVVMNHPQFHMTCDELQVYMNKEAEEEAAKEDPKKPATGSTTTKPPTAGDLAASGAADKPATDKDKDPDSRSNGNLKRAIAKGRKVLINKMSDKGVPQTGIGREADYDGATGDMILRGWPQIQEGQNLTVATEPSTYFLIKANGQFQAMGGRAQTRIIQEDEKKGPKAAGVSAPAPAPGAPPAPVINNRTQGGQ